MLHGEVVGDFGLPSVAPNFCQLPASCQLPAANATSASSLRRYPCQDFIFLRKHLLQSRIFFLPHYLPSSNVVPDYRLFSQLFRIIVAFITAFLFCSGDRTTLLRSTLTQKAYLHSFRSWPLFFLFPERCAAQSRISQNSNQRSRLYQATAINFCDRPVVHAIFRLAGHWECHRTAPVALPYYGGDCRAKHCKGQPKPITITISNVLAALTTCFHKTLPRFMAEAAASNGNELH